MAANDRTAAGEAALAELVRNLMADQFDRLLMMGFPEDSILAGMLMAIGDEMERTAGVGATGATLRAFAELREGEAAARASERPSPLH